MNVHIVDRHSFTTQITYSTSKHTYPFLKKVGILLDVHWNSHWKAVIYSCLDGKLLGFLLSFSVASSELLSKFFHRFPKFLHFRSLVLFHLMMEIGNIDSNVAASVSRVLNLNSG